MLLCLTLLLLRLMLILLLSVGAWCAYIHFTWWVRLDSVWVQRVVVELGRVARDAEPGHGVVLASLDGSQRSPLQASDNLQRSAQEVPHQRHGDGRCGPFHQHESGARPRGTCGASFVLVNLSL